MRKTEAIVCYCGGSFLAAYGVFAAVQNRKLADRVSTLERHVAGLAVLQANDLTVCVTKNREIEVQGAKISLQEFKALVSAISDKKERTVVLIVPKGVELNFISEVMESCRTLGFARLRLEAAGV